MLSPQASKNVAIFETIGVYDYVWYNRINLISIEISSNADDNS